jgi:hypothetical protein
MYTVRYTTQPAAGTMAHNPVHCTVPVGKLGAVCAACIAANWQFTVYASRGHYATVHVAPSNRISPNAVAAHLTIQGVAAAPTPAMDPMHQWRVVVG